jgi:hypothetical protein
VNVKIWAQLVDPSGVIMASGAMTVDPDVASLDLGILHDMAEPGFTSGRPPVMLNKAGSGYEIRLIVDQGWYVCSLTPESG